VIQTGFGVAATHVVALVVSGNLAEKVGHRRVAFPGRAVVRLVFLVVGLADEQLAGFTSPTDLPSAILLGLGIGMTIAPITRRGTCRTMSSYGRVIAHRRAALNTYALT
jgi:hypothetical protein